MSFPEQEPREDENGATLELSPSELLGDLPPEVPAQVTQMMRASLSMMGGVVNPIAERVTSQHITDIIGFADRDSEREFSDRKYSRNTSVLFSGFVLLVVVGLIFGLVLLASEELLRYVLIGVGSFMGGLGSGVGLSALRK